MVLLRILLVVEAPVENHQLLSDGLVPGGLEFGRRTGGSHLLSTNPTHQPRVTRLIVDLQKQHGGL